ncbi:MAG: glycosyltransferase [Armatimonadetes bacterium]|nr:glycosyltransferase [Armatimonadota bacterium]
MKRLAAKLHPARVARHLDERRRWSVARALPPARLAAETLAVAVAVRNRGGARVDRFLATLRAQTLPEQCVDVTIADFGSDEATLDQLRESCARFRARLVELNNPDPQWNKSWALNAAIRATSVGRYILATDIDMLFAPNFVETVLRAHLAFEPAIVLAQFMDLDRDALEGGLDPVTDFARLQAAAEWVGEHATGPCLSVSREWVERVRGFDERMVLWGYMDQDFSERALRDGLRGVWIHEQATMLHQWHPRKFEVHRGDAEAQALMRERFEANRRLFEQDQSIERNPGGWGEPGPAARVIEPPTRP